MAADAQIAADFIRAHEGCALTAYQDQGGIWTIAYGATGADIKEGTVWTQEQAEHRLQSDIYRFEVAVRYLVKVPLTPKQEAALVSFAYNLGSGALKESTLLTVVNQKDWLSAPGEFIGWDHVNGKQNKGLLLRRLREAALFLEGSP